MPPQGILESIDQLVAAFVPALMQMGTLLGTVVNMPAPFGAMPLSTAALTGFVQPWVSELGPICLAIAQFMNVL